jgi:hypothetical protein
LVTEDPILDLRSVRSVSHALDGLLRHRPLRICFAPQPRAGFVLQGFVPRSEAVQRFRCRCPLFFRQLRLRLPAPSKLPLNSGLCSSERVRWSSKPVKVR